MVSAFYVCGIIFKCKVKPVFSGHSKIDETKILITDGNLMQVKVLQNATLGPFWPALLKQ